MSLVDIVIIVAVAAALAFCVSRLARSGAGGCGDCASGSSCSVRATGEGTCKVAQDMVARADAAFKEPAAAAGEEGPRQGSR